ILAETKEGDLPLSFAQERQWFLAQLEPDSPLYNHAAGLRLSGRLEVAAFGQACAEIVRRHASFRSTFASVNGRMVQRILPAGLWPVPLVDLSALPPELGEGEGARIGVAEARRPFDLSRGALLRSLVVRLEEREHTAWFVMHHIAGDHWSAGVLVREFAALYAAFAERRPSPLPELPIQYVDFARWQRRWLSGDVLAAELDYWRPRLGGRLPVLELPTSRPRPAVQSPRGATQPLELSPTLSERVRALARSEKATPFMVLLTALDALLHHLTGEEDLIVGTPVAGRNRPELDGLIGYFINALALRTDLSGDPGFRELLGRIREVTMGAFAHQDLPFEKLVEELKPERRPGHSPIFQVVFNYQNASPAGPVELPGLTLRLLPAGRGTAKYDFTLYMWEEADRLAGAFEYKTDLFDAAAMARAGEAFITILECAAAQPDVRLSALRETLSAREMEKRMIRQDETSSSNLKKLKITKRRAVNVSQEDLVRTEYLDIGPLPLVVSPNLEDVDLATWAARSADFLDRELLTHGGILFRGFAVPSAAAFERFVNCVTPDLVNYVEGSSPRIMVGDKVYTSTEYPPEFFVSLHNELSYAHKWPSRIFFYCHTEPQQGGETPIADSRKVWQRIDPEVRRKFEAKGVIYTRNLHGDRGAGLSWQTVFETNDREAVEAYCREGGIELRWKEDGGLATRQVRRATVRHPTTGEPVWFNQV
ncbi:MAG TPA: condensation domain-containing protein, partial [Candidatus Nanopelagicales bacterium]|nr:condensation domain-containing protein [Candidatus Nanopelagicales bacterium]